MRTIFLTFCLLAGAYTYVLIETENRKIIKTPTKQKRTKNTRQKRRRKKEPILDYDAGTQTLAIGKDNGQLEVWNGQTGLVLLQATGLPIVSLTFSEDSQWLLSLDRRGMCQLWNMNTQTVALKLKKLSIQGFPKVFNEFVEVSTVYECLVFREQDRLIYYNYLTEELSAQPPLDMVNY